MNSSQLRRWLQKQGCTFEPHRGKGGHIIVRLGDKWATLPVHGGSHEVPKWLFEQIKKQLGLK